MGFSSSAIHATKQNRALLKKRKSFKDIRNLYGDTSKSSGVPYQELSDLDKKKIKLKIKAQLKLNKQKEIKIYLAAIGVSFVLIYAFYWLFTG